MTGRVEIRVEGLRELRRALSKVDPLDAKPELQAALKRAAGVVAADARRRVPSRTGRARDSIRAVSGGNRQYVVGGKKAVPYYGWLDFGSRTPKVGNPRTIGPWSGSGQGPRDGRFIYPALDAKEQEVVALVTAAVNRALDHLDL